MEPSEVQEFAHKLKESSEEGGESLRAISLAISILAVLVAMVTVLGHRAHTEAILMETRTSDQWNEYQAKKIRMDSLSIAVDLLSAQSAADSTAIRTKTTEYSAHIAKLKADLIVEQAKAHELEEGVTHAEAKAARFDLGEALLQIAVVLSSITLFTRNRNYFFLGLAIGTAGILVASSVMLLR